MFLPETSRLNKVDFYFQLNSFAIYENIIFVFIVTCSIIYSIHFNDKYYVYIYIIDSVII